MSLRILITCAGGSLIPTLTKFLKKDTQLGNIFIVGLDKNKIKKNPNLDNFYIVNEKKEKNYLIKLIKICRQEKINLLIPYSDNEAKIISKNKFMFSKYRIKVLVNNFKTIKIITNKYLTYRILKKKGLFVPKFKLVKNFLDIKKALNYFGYPKFGVVLKPAESIGGRGVLILKGRNNRGENWIGSGAREKIFLSLNQLLSENLFNNGPLIAMEILCSPAYDVDCFNHKKNKFTVIRKRINPCGLPYKGNYILKNKKIETYCRKIIKALNIKSLVDIDLLTIKKNNRPALLEINPRPSGSATVSYFANLPIFSYAIATIMNRKYKIYSSNLKLSKKIRI